MHLWFFLQYGIPPNSIFFSTNNSQNWSNISWIIFAMVITNLCLGFSIFLNWNFNIFFFIFVNMGSNGNENVKTHNSYTLQPKVFKLVLNPPTPPNFFTKPRWGLLKLSFWYLWFFPEISNSQCIPYEGTKNFSYLKDKQL